MTNTQSIFNQKLPRDTTTNNLRIILSFDDNTNITSNNKIIDYDALLTAQNVKNARLKIKKNLKIAQCKKQTLKKLIKKKRRKLRIFAVLQRFT